MSGRAMAALVGSLILLAGCGQGGSAPSGVDGAAARALLATLPPAYRSADLANGQLRFQLCRSCHNAGAGGANMTGPHLHGVFGRKAGAMPGFPYSAALAKTGFVWDADHLDRWLTKPRAYVPGTRMSFVGIKDDADRRDLIAYLKVVTSDPAR